MMCLFLAALHGATAQTCYVSLDGAHTPPYDSWAAAANDIQTAVDTAAASNWPCVLVATGLYTVSANVIVSDPLVLRSWNQSLGGEDRTNTIIDGGGNCAVLYVNHSNALVSGFTLTNGNGVGGGSIQNGGGVEMNGGILSNCVVAGNRVSNRGGGVYLTNYASVLQSLVCFNAVTGTSSAYDGGGLWVGDGTVSGVQVISNSAGRYAGGIYCNNEAMVEGCEFAWNHASDGGGVFIYRSATGLMKNSRIYANTANNNGGGVNAYLAFTNPIVNCVISNNLAGSGGGGVNGGVVSNCAIIDNLATNYGSGAMGISGMANTLIARNRGSGQFALYLYASSWTAAVDNCTIVSNDCRGMLLRRNVNVLNTIIYDNALENWSFDSDAGLSLTNCCTYPAIATNGAATCITNEPLFVGLTDGNYRLQAESPCVNAGWTAPEMHGALDLDGHARVDRFSGLVDMGCYEYLPAGMMFQVR